MVEYTYDSWGKPISVTGSLAYSLGEDQPFRYRGYVYDSDTQLYYLQSRYYDPKIGRFISADVYLSTGQGVIGNNCFAYCGNNPTNSSDSDGHTRVNYYTMENCCYYSGGYINPDAVKWLLDVLLLGGAFTIISTLKGPSVESSSSGSSSQHRKVTSDEINWNKNKDHILKGSKKKGHDWPDPLKGPDGDPSWEKILPLLKLVIDSGEKISEKPQNGGMLYEFEKFFKDINTTIIVRIYEYSDGRLEVSDAFPKW